MNDDAIQDLKQFITATISQQTSRLASRDDINRLENKIDDLSSSVAEALEQSNEAQESQLQVHNQRISRLEQNAT